MKQARVGGLLLLVVALLAGCSGGSGSSAASTSTTSTIPIPTPKLTSTVADGASDVSMAHPIGLTVTEGTLKTVAIELAKTGDVAAPGEGLLNAEGTGWFGPALAPTTAYRMVADVADTAGKTTKHTWAFTTGGPTKELHTTANVGDDSTYGVGMPLIVTLNEPIDEALRPDLVKRLSVTSTPAIEGAWRWISDTEVHYRPKEYWPAKTKVSLAIDFAHFNAGNGVWGVDGRTIKFNIGDSHITTVDAAAHRMVVRVNGAVEKDMAVSTGTDRYPTKSGIHVVNEKAETVIMDSATVGIPKGSPDYYLETVQWNVRISNSGEFVHSAPWSVGSQGYANVSHGCVNAAPADAEWFYRFTQTGDVVQVINTAEQLQSWNGYGDWQVPWAEWAN